MLNPADFVGEAMEPEICISESTYIVILCLGLLIISIILEMINVKMMKKAKPIKREIVEFLIVLAICLIGIIFFVKENGVTTVRGVECLHYSIWNTILYIILMISIIMVVRQLIYIIKQRKRKN